MKVCKSVIPAAMVIFLSAVVIAGAQFWVASESLGGYFDLRVTTVVSPAISGLLSGDGAVSIGNVTVDIAGPENVKVVSDANGYFSVSQLPIGEYTVTPSAPSFQFSPANQVITYNGSHLWLQFAESGGFIGSPFTVSGRLTSPSGIGLRNAKVVLISPDGITRAVPSSSMGYYNIYGFDGKGTHIIRVRSRRYRFESSQVLLDGKYLTRVDFVGLE